VSYLLDAYACVAQINGKPESLRAPFRAAVNAGEKIPRRAFWGVVKFQLSGKGVYQALGPLADKPRLQELFT